MRKIVGGAVLAIGTGALGWWGSVDHAARMEREIAEAADAVTRQATHEIEVSVAGRDITLTGLADTAQERDALIAAMRDIPGRRVVRDTLDILPVAAPYVLTGEKTAEDLTFAGSVPSAGVRAMLADEIGAASDPLELATGIPDDNWIIAAMSGAQAINATKSGSLQLEDKTVSLTGLVATPVEESRVISVLAGIPQDYEVTLDLDVEDDGKPFRLMASKLQSGEIEASGKLPVGQSVEILDQSGATDISHDLQIARIAGPKAWETAAGVGLMGLGQLVDGTLNVSEDTVTLAGRATLDGKESALVTLGGMPDGYQTETNIDIYDDGRAMFVAAEKSATGVTATDGKLPLGFDAPALSLSDLDMAEIDAKSPDFGAVTEQGLAALALMTDGTLRVTDATDNGPLTVELDGTVGDPSGQAALDAALGGLTNLGVDTSATIQVLDDGKPLALAVSTGDDGVIASGKIAQSMSTQAVADALGAQAVDAQALTQAGISGEADADFAQASQAGLAALAALNAGTLDIAGGSVSLTGVATRDGRASALAALDPAPAGYEVQTDISLDDDGQPIALRATKADGATSLSGKLPFGATAQSLGVADLGADADVAEIDAQDPAFLTTANAGLVALDALEAGSLTLIDGTPATLSIDGSGTRAGEAAARAALQGVGADLALTYLDDGEPLELLVSKSNGLAVEGKLPFGADASAYGLDDLGTATVSEIDAIDPDFAQTAQRGVAALKLMDQGALSVTDGTPSAVTLSGSVATPADRDAVLAALGTGATAQVTALDDGAPAAFDFTFDATTGAGLTGKLPNGLSAEAIADVMILPSVEADVTEGFVGDAAPAQAAFEALAGWLPELDSAALQDDGAGNITVQTVAAPGTDAELIASGLAADFDGIAGVSVEPLSTLPASGTERVNVSTGLAERFNGLAWLPAYDFDATLDNCTGETLAILERSRINFVTGSARLDARSMRAVNALSATVQHCVLNDPTFRVEVGGHTDSDGSEEGNQTLSQQRADAVVEALIARGVGPGVLTPIGFGESNPIASNDTEEGRAENRRTTFEWSQETE